MVRPFVIQALVLLRSFSHTDKGKETSLLGYDAVRDSSKVFTVSSPRMSALLQLWGQQAPTKHRHLPTHKASYLRRLQHIHILPSNYSKAGPSGRAV